MSAESPAASTSIAPDGAVPAASSYTTVVGRCDAGSTERWIVTFSLLICPLAALAWLVWLLN